VFRGTAIDNAGNSRPASDCDSQHYKPLHRRRLRSPRPSRQHRTPRVGTTPSVTVTFSCAAGSNPLATCSSHCRSVEGANQSCAATRSTQRTFILSLSKDQFGSDPPTIAIFDQPSVNPNGWFTSPVSLRLLAVMLSPVWQLARPPAVFRRRRKPICYGIATDNRGTRPHRPRTRSA